MQSLPFPVKDNLLAVCLHINGQQPYRAERHYSAEYLEKVGCNTVREAEAKGHPGVIKYSFVRSDKTARIVDAYYDEVKKCKDRIAVIDDPAISAADITRILVAGFIARGLYAKNWRDIPSMLAAGGESKFTATETVTITRELMQQNPHLWRDGKFYIDGKEYREGDALVTGGVLEVAPMSVVSTKMKPELRAEVNL